MKQSEIYFVSFVKALHWRPFFYDNLESMVLDIKTSKDVPTVWSPNFKLLSYANDRHNLCLKSLQTNTEYIQGGPITSFNK